MNKTKQVAGIAIALLGLSANATPVLSESKSVSEAQMGTMPTQDMELYPRWACARLGIPRHLCN